MEAEILIDSFADFARNKNIDRPTMIRILEDVFRTMIRKKYKGLFIITPGIRMPGDDTNDQARVVTPKDAFKNKVSGIVIGRSLTKGNIKNNLKRLIDHLYR